MLVISKGETYTFVTHSLPRTVWSHSSIYAFQQFSKEVTAAPCVRPLPALGKRYCPHHRSYQPQRWTKKKRRGVFFNLVCLLLRALEKAGLFLLESLAIPKLVQALISVLWSLLWRGCTQILLSTLLCPTMPWKAIEFLVTLTDAQFKRDSINSELLNITIFKTLFSFKILI